MNATRGRNPIEKADAAITHVKWLTFSEFKRLCLCLEVHGHIQMLKQGGNHIKNSNTYKHTDKWSVNLQYHASSQMWKALSLDGWMDR